MKPECGITFDSLDNARELIAKHGTGVARIDFMARVKGNYYVVEIRWTNGTRFRFDGFSWGYTGTGPAGLDELLRMLNIHDINAASLPIDKFGVTDCTYFVNETPNANHLSRVRS